VRSIRHALTRLFAGLTAALVAGCLLIGSWHANSDRSATLRGATAKLPVRDGRLTFVPPRLPEQFLLYVADRVPAGDPVEYVPADLALCGPGVRKNTWWGRLLWAQYRLAPRRMACGAAARWRVYLGAVPPGVPATDRWSDSFALVQVRG